MKQSTLSDWIAHVFDHPVTDPAWHWDLNAPEWNCNAERDLEFMADAFERAGDSLADFSDKQLNQGFWYLISGNCTDFMFSLVEPTINLALRLRSLRSFVPVFEQVMVARCSPHISHIDERGAKPLNASCYMWWDILPIHGRPDLPERVEFDSEVLVTLKRLLEIPHDACRESALHGIGHWACYYPGVGNVVDEFLARTPDLRPELLAYATSAKVGGLL